MILLVVIRFMTVGDALCLQLLPTLTVNVLHRTGLRERVILKDTPHMIQQSRCCEHELRLCETVLPVEEEVRTIAAVFRCLFHVSHPAFRIVLRKKDFTEYILRTGIVLTCRLLEVSDGCFSVLLERHNFPNR